MLLNGKHKVQETSHLIMELILVQNKYCYNQLVTLETIRHPFLYSTVNSELLQMAD